MSSSRMLLALELLAPPLPSLLQLLRGPLARLYHARVLWRLATCSSTLVPQVFELLSFPIYHILVIIFHSKQAGLLLYVNSHRTSDPGSLEKSRGTLPLMETSVQIMAQLARCSKARLMCGQLSILSNYFFLYLDYWAGGSVRATAS